MSIFQILSPDFRNELPDDDRLAFGMIVERATDWLADRLKEVDETERASWQAYESAQLSVMNVVIASAKHYQIEPFAKMIVPRRDKFDSNDFVEFQTELDHYLIQIMLDNTMRLRRDTAAIDSKSREKIRDYLNVLKKAIDDAEMSEAKRSALRSKLSQFEAELDKSRVPIFMLARILLEVVSLTANVVALAESPTFHKIVSNTFQAVAVVKAEDDGNRQLPPTEPPKALLPPRPVEERRRGSATTEGYDLNDDIPF
jgi:hypothetical protein